MSFTSSLRGTTFEAGYFLVDDENCLRLSTTISAQHAQRVTRNGRVIVPMGAVIPANDATAKGILYEDIDVTEGDAFGSIVVEGTVYGDRLPAAIAGSAASALANITVKTAPAMVRPAIFSGPAKLSVASVEGATSGKSTITVTGYRLVGSESYVYKVGDSATEVKAGDDLSSGWTALTNGGEITATTGKTITVAVKDSDNKATGVGTATVTAKA